MITMADLEVRLSGGAANTDPNAALGGIISSERVLSQSSTGITNVTGVVINYACGNTLGGGTLAFTFATKLLKWTPQGGTIGTGVDITASGRYVIADSTGNQQLMVTVTAGSLPGTDQSDTITIANIANETFDDIAKAESLYGDTEYRCVYVKNTHASESALQVTFWIGSNTTGADDLHIGEDPAGVGNGSTTGVATTIANESTAPTGVTFTQPVTQGTGIVLGDLAFGECAALWIKRVVPASTTSGTAADLSSIGISAYL